MFSGPIFRLSICDFHGAKIFSYRVGKYVRVRHRYIMSDIHPKAGYISVVHVLAKLDLMRIMILKYL